MATAKQPYCTAPLTGENAWIAAEAQRMGYLPRLPVVTVKIHGLEEAQAILRDFPAKLERKVLRQALNGAAAIGQAAAKDEARKHAHTEGDYTTLWNQYTGREERVKYDKSVRHQHLYGMIRRHMKSSHGVIRCSVGDFGDMPHGWLLEHGHRMVVGGTVMRISGKQAGKTPKARSRERTGAGRVLDQVVPPHPWISVAFDRSAGPMMSFFETELLARAKTRWPPWRTREGRQRDEPEGILGFRDFGSDGFPRIRAQIPAVPNPQFPIPNP